MHGHVAASVCACACACAPYSDNMAQSNTYFLKELASNLITTAPEPSIRYLNFLLLPCTWIEIFPVEYSYRLRQRRQPRLSGKSRRSSPRPNCKARDPESKSCWASHECHLHLRTLSDMENKHGDRRQVNILPIYWHILTQQRYLRSKSSKSHVSTRKHTWVRKAI